MRKNKTSIKQLHSMRRRRLAIALLAVIAAPGAALAQNGCAECLPSYGKVVSGSATSNYDNGGLIRPNAGNANATMTITQTTKGAIIDWGSFNISQDYKVAFIQPTNGVVLNRVIGFGYGAGGCSSSGGCAPTFSSIEGSLSATGSVFIVNPAGIAFDSTGTNQISVGSLVASTMNITDKDFLTGVTTGRYAFQPPAPGVTDVNSVSNGGDITTASGGTVAFVGAGLANLGNITAPGGSVVFGSGNQVTLDFFGDGLTQITVTGPGVVDRQIGVIDGPAPPPFNGMAFNSGTITADGGQILMRVAAVPGNTMPGIWNTGTLRAQTMVNRAGRVELTAPGGAIFMGSTFGDSRKGVIDVSGGAFAGGSALLDGGSVLLGGVPGNPNNSSMIDGSGGVGGGQVDIRATTSIVAIESTSINANALSTGNGGSVSLVAGDLILSSGDITARGGTTSGNGGTIGISSTAGPVGINSLDADGSPAGNGGGITVSAPTVAVFGPVSARGGANGGSVQLLGGVIGLGEDASVNVDGGTGTGGSIVAAADTTLVMYGALSARGGSAGGSILTSTGGQFDVRGLNVDAGSAGAAGTWTFEAPAMTVISGSETGTGGTAVLGTTLQDAELNNAFATGTNIVLQATQGDVQFDDAQILAAYASPLFLHVNATGAIYGSGFSIGSSGGALDLLFNADSAGGNDNGGYIDFSNGSMSSNGGLIAMFGQSNQTTGFATGYADGVSLQGMDIDSAGGGVVVRGHSTGDDAGSDNAGVVLVDTNIDSGGGNVDIHGTGMGSTSGVIASGGSLLGGGGMISLVGVAEGPDAIGVALDGIQLTGGTGSVTVDGSSPLGIGVRFANGASVTTTSGAISLIGKGANFGLDLGDGAVDTDTGDIGLDGTALATTATAGVRMTGGGLTTNGGDIKVTGKSAGGVGIQLGDGGAFAIGSGGGAIAINGTGVTRGVWLAGSTTTSGGGSIDIEGSASGADATGVYIDGMAVNGGVGDVAVKGFGALGSGVMFANGAGVSTTSGAITLIGIGERVGLSIDGGEFVTETGHLDLRGRGLGATSDGLLIGRGISITTNGGGIELSGEGGSGAGLSLAAGSTIDAGNSLVVLRAGNDASSDAIRLQGKIRSGVGVNLRPGGVDANGGLTERTGENILVGGAAGGFALSAAELTMIDAPELIIGSNLHAGAIQVVGAVSRDGNLTLQNDGGSGGIAIQAALDVGIGTLALSSGGSITQTIDGVVTAHSLLAIAAGDVLLGDARNNVAATTLAGSAGGAFEFQDVDTLAIGNVSAVGFDASSGALASLSANGIEAGGDVLVRNLAGDMILNADVRGANIDLVTAGRLQNTDGADLIAPGTWRVWAATWEGESRGGLAGSGSLPNLYGCQFLGACGVTVPETDNHFIYVQQPTALITIDSFRREYGLANPALTFTVTGAILGDTANNAASGTPSTSATIASDVGTYAINGVFTSAAGYRIQVMPGTLGITPATLFFTADSSVRYLGSPNPNFTGSVSGFRNGDTVESVFGPGNVWSSPADLFAHVGFYPVNGGTNAKNYVFSQAPGNATALQVIPLPQLSSTPIDLIRETINTYVYDRNFGGAPVCAVNATIDDERIASTGDELSNEWSKVRSRPNLTNCFDTERKNGCDSF